MTEAQEAELMGKVRALQESVIQIDAENGLLKVRVSALERTLSAIKTRVDTVPLNPPPITPMQAARGVELPVNSMMPASSNPVCR